MEVTLTPIELAGKRESPLQLIMHLQLTADKPNTASMQPLLMVRAIMLSSASKRDAPKATDSTASLSCAADASHKHE